MLEMSEVPLRRNDANFLATEANPNKLESNSNNKARMIEFDRGIPRSFDYAMNTVNTIAYNLHSILFSVLRKIFSRPLHVLLMLLIIFYIIIRLSLPTTIIKLDVAVTFYAHICMVLLEVLYELYLYYCIYLNDLKTNSQSAFIYDLEHKCFVTATWADIRVGHIIKVCKDEIVPADLIILETMDSSHQCLLDVSAINGIFDSFIIKKACIDTQTPSMKTIKFNEYVKKIKGILKYEEENSNMHSFSGRLKLESFPRATDVGEENFIMRGSTIKNIKCIYGLVVYTGMETKIMQILKNDTSKNNFIIKEHRNLTQSAIGVIHYIIIGIYILIILLLSLAHINKTYLITTNNITLFYDYLGLEAAPYTEFFYTFVQFLYTFHLIIPFTFFNLIIISYGIFSLFVRWDIKILQKPKNKVEIINNDSLADFGQVRYILTDKTGTLTSRKFILKACSIHGKIYSFDPLDRKDENYIFRMKNYDMTDLELYQELKSNSNFSNYIKEFFEYLCVCHSVKVRSNDKKNNQEVLNNDLAFGSSYAEEKSTLKMLKNLGYCVTKTKSDKVMMDINGDSKSYCIIGTNKYSHERKRMSVIVKRYKNDTESILLCKGNDMSIFNYIKSENEGEINMMKDQIKKLSSIGYRFFVFCKKDLSEDETTNYMTKYKSAENYVLQRQVHFDRLAAEFEYDMELMGVLFFEEKVSSDLRYSINKLNNSNIHVWVVSGDRKENVMAVSKNLDMYKHNSVMVEFSEKDDLDDLDIKMNMHLLQFLGAGEQMMRMVTRKGVNINVEGSSAATKKGKPKELTILIHGACFDIICKDPRLYQCFTTLLSYTTNLFAYSFSPNHKFLLCQTVKKYITKNTKVLAIGDGLNDFMMLKEADLSIGIRSREILQVRNTCDVIVSKFPQIVDLILVHGTWNVKRIFSICIYSFYANFLIIFPFFLNQNTNPEGSSFFNVNYTKLVLDILIINMTIILCFCFDHEIERPLIGLNPSIYLENFQSKQDVILRFTKSVAKATIDSFIIYYCIFILKNPFNILGENIDASLLGNVIQNTCYFLIYFKLITLKLHIISISTVFIIFISIGALIGFNFIDQEIIIVATQGLSYLNIILCSAFSISCCYLYEKLLSGLAIFYDPNFIYKLTVKFKKFVDDYILFINFEDILKEISAVNIIGKRRIDRITYQEVLQKIFYHNKGIDPVLDNMTDINNDKMAILKIRTPFLKFYDEKTEKDYQNTFSQNLNSSFLCYLITLFIFWLVDMGIQAAYSNLYLEKVSKTLKIIYIFSGILLLIKPFKLNFLQNYSIFYYVSMIIEIICIYVEKSDNDTKICIQTFILFSYPLFFANRNFRMTSLGAVFYYLAVLPSVFLNDFNFSVILNNPYFLYANLPLLYHRTTLILGILSIMLTYGYYEELASRISFLKYNKKTLDCKKDYEIYANLVPDFVREKMLKGGRGAEVNYEMSTILFCDVAEFDRLVAGMTAKDVIYLLDKIYNTFDQLCTLHGLQKIETVGKTYMASGGIKACEKDMDENILKRHHAIRTFELAKDMLDIMQKLTLENGEIVKIKIGIHTGQVIAAVVGQHKPQFSLVGDTINTTARMCYYSQDMCVTCSEMAYEHINKVYNDFTMSEKDVKGKGWMKLYSFNPNKNILVPAESKLKNLKMENNLSVVNKNARQGSLRKNTFLGINTPVQKQDANLNRQISKISNQSAFIFENSQDIPAEQRSVAVVKEEKKKIILSKKMTVAPSDMARPGNKTESVDKNLMFKDSNLFFKFKDANYKNYFDLFSSLKFSNSVWKSTVLNYIYVLIMAIGLYYLSEYNYGSGKTFIFLIIKVILLLCLIILTNESTALMASKPKTLQNLTIIIFLCFTIVIQLHMNFVDNYFLVNIIMEQNFTILVITYGGLLMYRHIAYNLIIYIAIFIVNIGINSGNNLFVKYLLFTIIICFIVFAFIVMRTYISTFEYLRNKKESEELKTIEDLLFNLMPQHVVQNLKEDIPVADVLYDVTMLFADICGFTDFSTGKSPVDVVNMLSELFTDFDNACLANNLYKVHTIGDCYVLMSFTGKVALNERNYKEEAKNVVKMGLKMIEIIQDVRVKIGFMGLDMRIGIHTGKVIAGIIGTKVVRYDIFGSDVLIANKMESGGEKGHVNVSEDTRNLLDSDGEKSTSKYIYTVNKTIHIAVTNQDIKSFLIREDDGIFQRENSL